MYFKFAFSLTSCIPVFAQVTFVSNRPINAIPPRGMIRVSHMYVARERVRVRSRFRVRLKLRLRLRVRVRVKDQKGKVVRNM
jgi:hypothetical protein